MSGRVHNNFQFIDVGRADPDKKRMAARRTEYVEIYDPFTKKQVEEQSDFDWLRNAGIDFVQGNFVDSPVALGSAPSGSYRIPDA